MDDASFAAVGADGYVRRWDRLGAPRGFSLPARSYFSGSGCSGAAYVLPAELPSIKQVYAHPLGSGSLYVTPPTADTFMAGFRVPTYFEAGSCHACAGLGCDLGGLTMYTLENAASLTYGATAPFTLN